MANKDDGGLIETILDHVVTLAATDLSGFAGFGESFNTGSNVGQFPRLVVEMTSNRLIGKTCDKKQRRCLVQFTVYDKAAEELLTEKEKVSDVLDRWEEDSNEIAALMPVGATINEMQILSSVRRHEQEGLWSYRFLTTWSIWVDR